MSRHFFAPFRRFRFLTPLMMPLCQMLTRERCAMKAMARRRRYTRERLMMAPRDAALKIICRQRAERAPAARCARL